MSEGGFSLVDLKGVSAPITKLIESVSKGVGTIYEPTKKVRNAKAEAKAMLILAQAKHEMNELESRTLERVKHKELRRQSNIDLIVEGAAKNIADKVSSEPVDEDWLINFFELSQDIGNEQLQQVWSKILAGEVAKPGSFSPRTLQAIKELTSEEANSFVTLCSFSFQQGNKYLFPCFNHDFYVYIRENGLSAQIETHLKNIGLLNHTIIHQRSIDENEIIIPANYFSTQYYLKSEPDEVSDDTFQYFPLTGIGNELARISGAEKNEEYISCLVNSGNVVLKT